MITHRINMEMVGLIKHLVQSSALVSQRLEFRRPEFFSRERCGSEGEVRHIVERRAITEKQDIS